MQPKDNQQQTQEQNPNQNFNQMNGNHLPPKAALKPTEKKIEPLFSFPIIYVLPSQAKYIQMLNEKSTRTRSQKR